MHPLFVRVVFLNQCYVVVKLYPTGLFRLDSVLYGHYRLSQDTDNQTKVFVVVTKRKEEVSGASWTRRFLFDSEVFLKWPDLLPHCLTHCLCVFTLQRNRFCRRNPATDAEHSFHVGLQLTSGGRQRFNKLVWIHHSCHITYRYHNAHSVNLPATAFDTGCNCFSCDNMKAFQAKAKLDRLEFYNVCAACVWGRLHKNGCVFEEYKLHICKTLFA